MAAELGPGPDVEHHHHHHTGHRWLDITLGVSAVFISLMSLLLAIQHGRAMERMVEMSSWPYVVVQDSTARPDGSPRILLNIINSGVGPAKVESIEVFYNGEAQTDPNSLVRSMLKISDPNREMNILESDAVDSVLPARDSRDLMDVLLSKYSTDEYQVLRKAMGKVTYRVCYCSVFDECSVVDSRKDGKAERIKACPVPKTMFLH
jgi:hypothetical protein